MYIKKRNWFIIMFILFLLPACSADHSSPDSKEKKKVELTISAAASLSNAFGEIKSNFEKSNKDITLSFNLGGSGALKQQILQGAPADIFVSAAKDQFDELTKKGLIDTKKHTELLSNQLVLITNKTKPAPITSFEDLSKNSIDKIAIGTPESVPAGMYAKQTLNQLKAWDSLQQKIIQTKDVRQVLTYVETGSVDAGIVYMTDVKISDKVKVAAVAKDNSHDPIIYSAGIIKSTAHMREATLFFDYLQSEEARTIFEKYGFIVLD